MNYGTKDVVMLKENWGGKSTAYVILFQKPDGSYSAQVLGSSQKKVGLPADSIAAKIGTLENADMANIYAPLKENIAEKNAKLAQSQAQFFENHGSVNPGANREAEQWKILSTMTEGDPIQLRFQGKVETLTFGQMLPRGQKFKFTAKRRTGGHYKWPVSAVYVPAGEKVTS